MRFIHIFRGGSLDGVLELANGMVVCTKFIPSGLSPNAVYKMTQELEKSIYDGDNVGNIEYEDIEFTWGIYNAKTL